VKNPFTPPAIPNAIRRQMIKDTFPEKISEYGRQKDMAVSAMRKISDELVEDFEKHMRIMDKSRYKHLREASEEESEMDFDFGDWLLNEIASRVFRIKNTIPPKGRIAYQFLPAVVKEAVDSLVQSIIKENPAVKSLVDVYVQSKLNLTKLYSSDEEYLKNMEGKFRKEAEKIIANRILGMVKSLNRFDNELKSKEYIQSRREYYAAQMLYEIMDMLTSLTHENNNRYMVAEIYAGPALFCCITQDGDIIYEDYNADQELQLKQMAAETRQELDFCGELPYRKLEHMETGSLAGSIYFKVFEGMDAVMLCRYSKLFGYEFVTCAKASGSHNKRKLYKELRFYDRQAAQESFLLRGGFATQSLSPNLTVQEIGFMIECLTKYVMLDNDLDGGTESRINGMIQKMEAVLPESPSVSPKQFFIEESI